jgi:hypothetical protein
MLSEIIPTILSHPRHAGRPKQGDLVDVFAHAFTDQGVAYRLVYTIDDSRRMVTFIAFGPHDAAYARARRRK